MKIRLLCSSPRLAFEMHESLPHRPEVTVFVAIAGILFAVTVLTIVGVTYLLYLIEGYEGSCNFENDVTESLRPGDR
jgi:hypothetical protein